VNSYLEQLAIRLAVAMAALDTETRARHANWLLALQREDGGFAGREGDSDLYYTSFGLRGLSMLGELNGEPAERAAAFLLGKLASQQTIIDFLSLIYAGFLLDTSAGIDIFADSATGWQDAVASTLESLRRDDGGYAKGPDGRASSTYHSFLVTICLQLLDRLPPNPDSLTQFIYSQASDDGGFLEIRAGKRAGTNPTAAAIGTLRVLDGLTEETRQQTIEFLADMQTDEGGLRANTRIPIADLLSSFTGLLTLSDLNGEDEVDRRKILQYARSLEVAEGGFFGAVWDQAADVEYTFYGLGTLALSIATA
jgi:geranylgeranyl transferase type-2 subunit beta